MSIMLPGEALIEWMKDVIRCEAPVLRLYKNIVVPGSSTSFAALTELSKDGGEAYAEIPLSNIINETAPTAGQWFVSLNAQGQAVAQYGLAAAPPGWTFNATDVADVETVYGCALISYQIPFTGGAKQIRVGDTIQGVTSGATGIVTAVDVESGSWGAAAAGKIKIMSKSATAFQTGENITLKGIITTVAIDAHGTSGYNVGDIVGINQTGAFGAKIVVLGVSAPGGYPTSIALVPGDSGFLYAAAAGLTTTHLSGSGDDTLTITITVTPASNPVYAVTNTGTSYGGDALVKLFGIDNQATGTLISATGQIISYLPEPSLATQ